MRGQAAFTPIPFKRARSLIDAEKTNNARGKRRVNAIEAFFGTLTQSRRRELTVATSIDIEST